MEEPAAPGLPGPPVDVDRPVGGGPAALDEPAFEDAGGVARLKDTGPIRGGRYGF
ncbi:hypothetical protein PWG71_21705 [Nocardiopsis sp. N85]|uniref:hypothetical protein n=1 Tax=Nocardiopsis sp. N85 TaxID=3029400 RepID=UPI00237F8979|nr:hypothetical protein [Nocardiopsis sp. N85]MDE3724014.1 hypothetical protein [Nocardiopsis sp. N85]